MSRYVKGEDKGQLSMVLMSFDEMIPDNHPVRVVDAFVDTLDMEKLGFKYANTKIKGRKPYNPKHLLKLYIYGYLNGVRSTRKLEKETHRNIEVMWLIDQLKPDDKTISNFRTDNQKSLIGVFKEFSMICSELGLYGKQMIAIDGSKFRASNSRHKSFTKRKVKKMLEYFEKCAEEYIKLLKESDKNEELELKIKETKEDIEEKLQAVKKRIKELKEMAEEIEKNGEISITDPDARHMSVSNNGTDISHNVQISVDSKKHLVVAIDVVNTPADQHQLHNMAVKTVEELGLKDKAATLKDEEDGVITVLADKGYYCGEELEKCKEDKIKTIVPKQKSSTKTGNDGFAKDRFIYDQAKDVYVCPNNQELHNKEGTRGQGHCPYLGYIKSFL
ncbi:IS1182 family transposase [Alkaliphilus serpentinus]|uniref:IS1182 family transposase n=1 Tax=Alkaliphilus serpentinus TaxID=1482731 RepID=A0A833HLE5_9FIRM|nr:IS1182 family transposase [Alkaliphilus serpentinus]KAB3525723.1 IS1182 family transposase [Alkaliphilus serpentinus]